MLEFFKEQHMYRFYGTSLFIVCGIRRGQPAYRFAMSDFGRATPIKDLMGIDSGYIFALTKLIAVLRQVVNTRRRSTDNEGSPRAGRARQGSTHVDTARSLSRASTTSPKPPDSATSNAAHHKARGPSTSSFVGPVRGEPQSPPDNKKFTPFRQRGLHVTPVVTGGADRDNAHFVHLDIASTDQSSPLRKVHLRSGSKEHVASPNSRRPPAGPVSRVSTMPANLALNDVDGSPGGRKGSKPHPRRASGTSVKKSRNDGYTN